MQAFFNVIFHIDALEAALHFHKMAGEEKNRPFNHDPFLSAGMSMSARDLERIIKKISNVDLPEDVVFVAVTIFDENGVSEEGEGEGGVEGHLSLLRANPLTNKKGLNLSMDL